MTEQEKKGSVLAFLLKAPAASLPEKFYSRVGCSAQQLLAWCRGSEEIPEDKLAVILDWLDVKRYRFDSLVKNYDKFTAPGHRILE